MGDGRINIPSVKNLVGIFFKPSPKTCVFRWPKHSLFAERRMWMSLLRVRWWHLGRFFLGRENGPWRLWKKGEKTKARNWHLNITLSYQLSKTLLFLGWWCKIMSEFSVLEGDLGTISRPNLATSSWGKIISIDRKMIAHNKSLQLIEPYRFAPIHLYRGSIGFCWCLSSGGNLLELWLLWTGNPKPVVWTEAFLRNSWQWFFLDTGWIQ